MQELVTIAGSLAALLKERKESDDGRGGLAGGLPLAKDELAVVVAKRADPVVKHTAQPDSSFSEPPRL